MGYGSGTGTGTGESIIHWTIVIELLLVSTEWPLVVIVGQPAESTQGCSSLSILSHCTMHIQVLPHAVYSVSIMSVHSIRMQMSTQDIPKHKICWKWAKWHANTPWMDTYLYFFHTIHIISSVTLWYIYEGPYRTKLSCMLKFRVITAVHYEPPCPGVSHRGLAWIIIGMQSVNVNRRDHDQLT